MTSAMNRIVDALLGAANLFRFWFVVDEFERAVVLRLGRFNRDAGPGLHRRLPFGLEREIKVNVRQKSGCSWEQTLTTTDRVTVSIGFSYCVDVVDARHVLLNLDSWQNVAYQIVRVATAEMVQASDFDRFMSEEFHSIVRDDCRARLRANGIGLPLYGLIERAATPAFRLFNGPK